IQSKHVILDPKTYSKKFTVAFGLILIKITGDFSSDSNKIVSYRTKSVVGSWFSSFGDAPGGIGEEVREFSLSVGAEYSYNNQFMVRAGYFYEDKTKGNRKFFTVGFGIKYNVFGLNFSYLVPSGQGINRNPLSNTLRFGLVFDIDKESAPATE
ncbi:MAG: PorV/PorQ family protein, partial [Chitinophagaceae bacterium]